MGVGFARQTFVRHRQSGQLANSTFHQCATKPSWRGCPPIDSQRTATSARRENTPCNGLDFDHAGRLLLVGLGRVGAKRWRGKPTGSLV